MPKSVEFQRQALQAITRRHFFGKAAVGIGGLALTSLLNDRLFAGGASAVNALAPKQPHFPAKAKRVVLPGIDAQDPLALTGAVAMLLTVAGIAAYLPARRASLIQPMDAVRAD